MSRRAGPIRRNRGRHCTAAQTATALMVVITICWANQGPHSPADDRADHADRTADRTGDQDADGQRPEPHLTTQDGVRDDDEGS